MNQLTNGKILPLNIPAKRDNAEVVAATSNLDADEKLVAEEVNDMVKKINQLVGCCERLNDAIEAIVPPPNYVSPTVSISLDNRVVEAGTSISERVMLSFNQNDAGLVKGYVFLRNGRQVGLFSTYEDIFVIGREAVTYQGQVPHDAGPVKNNVAGQPDSRGQIQAGTVSSPLRKIEGLLKLFYGADGAIPEDSDEIRSLPQEAWESTGEVILTTGTQQKIFVVAIPDNKTIAQVIDLGNLNADITSAYQQQGTVQVKDAAGALHTYKKYIMTNAVPYTNSTQHKITIQ